MISANELRRGNVIMFDDGSNQIVRVDWMFYHLDQWFVQWGDLSGGSLEKGNSFLMDFLPIPLTPEILEKCGFEWEVFYQGYWNGEFTAQLLHDASVSLKRKRLGEELFPNRNIKYLHQLQNAIFAITGTELNYKP